MCKINQGILLRSQIDNRHLNIGDILDYFQIGEFKMIFFLQIRNNELNKAVKKKLREKGLLLGNLDNDIVERRKRTVKYQTVY